MPPDKVIEVQALIGDSTDNVPGVPGIGVKTAAQLIGEYGDLETLLKRARRDQAGQAPPGARRQCRGCAYFQKTRHARRPRAAGCADRKPRRARAGLQSADRFSQVDGLQNADATRRRERRASMRAQVEATPRIRRRSKVKRRPLFQTGRTSGQGQLPLDCRRTPRKDAPGPGPPALTPISLAERRLDALRASKLDRREIRNNRDA